MSKFSWGHAFYKMNGRFIERYRTCHTHEEVQVMAEKIQDDLQAEYDKDKAEKGEYADRPGDATTLLEPD